MENKIPQVTDNYYGNLNRLLRYFAKTGAGYAFASIENQRHIQAINVHLKEVLSGSQLNLVLFSFDHKSDLPWLTQLQSVIRPGANAIVVNNLGLMAELSDGMLTRQGSNFLLEFNFAREELHNLNIPILFWASSNLLSIIGNHAADLYTQRSINTVYFDNIPDEPQQVADLATRFTSDYRNTPDYESLELKIKLLKKQLTDAEENNYPYASIANQLALPLAKTYSEIDLHAQANELLEKYDAWFNKNDLDTLRSLADIAKNGNQYETAMGYYKTAILGAEIVGIKYALPYLYYHLGDIYQELGEFEQALKFFNSIIKIAKELIETNPITELKNFLSISYLKSGVIHKVLGDYDQSLSFFLQANKLMLEILEANPESENQKNGLAVSYSKLGEIYQKKGNYDQAWQYFNLECDLFKELLNANPKSENLKRGLAHSYGMLGDYYQTMRDYEKARIYFQWKSDLLKEAFNTNPKSADLKTDLAISYEKTGGVSLLLNNVDEAKENFGLSLEIFRDLAADNNQSINNQSDYAEVVAILAMFDLQKDPNDPKASELINQSILKWLELIGLIGKDLYKNKIDSIRKFQSGQLDFKSAIIGLIGES
jgi:tetratricopeptide (TPR) repeat protein